MGSVVIALLLAVGASTWIYTKFMKQTGSNTRSSLIAAAASGLLLFFLTWIIANLIGL